MYNESGVLNGCVFYNWIIEEYYEKCLKKVKEIEAWTINFKEKWKTFNNTNNLFPFELKK